LIFHHFFSSKLLYATLRFSSLGSKFLFLIIANKYLDPKDVVNYYLINFTLVFFIYFFNFEVSATNAREYFLSKCAESNQKNSIFDFHFSFIILSCFIGGTLTFLYFTFITNLYLSITAALLFIIEYLSKDIERWLVLFDKQVSAAISLFLRTASWVFISVSFIIFGNTNVLYVYAFSISFGFLSIFFGLFMLYPCLQHKLLLTMPPVREIKKVIMKSIKLFISILLIKMIFSLDKQLLTQLSDNKILTSVYFFFFSFSYLTLTACETLLFNFEFPKLLKNINDPIMSNKVLFRSLQRKTITLTLLFFLLVSLVCSISIIYTGKQHFFSHWPLFLLLAVAVVLFTIQQVYRFWLYAFKKDTEILYISLFMSLGFILSLFFLNIAFDFRVEYIIAQSILVSTMAGLLISFIFYKGLK